MPTGGTYQISRNSTVARVGSIHRASITVNTNRTFFSPRLSGPSSADCRRMRDRLAEMVRTSGTTISFRIR